MWSVEVLAAGVHLLHEVLKIVVHMEMRSRGVANFRFFEAAADGLVVGIGSWVQRILNVLE